MTLILTFGTPRYIIQVSDRFVTQGQRLFDPVSNKTVIYYAKNAIVSIGYSGLAYLEDVPTDQWIAQKMRGEDRYPESEPGKPPAMISGRAQHWLDIGRSMELIRHDCGEVFSRVAPQVRPRQQFAIAGWQWRCRGRRGMARPIVCEVGNSEEPSGRHVFRAECGPRYWHWEGRNRLFLSWIPDCNPLSASEMSNLEDELKRTWPSPDASGRLLVETIRLAARKSSSVGPDCMCVFMPPPSAGIVDVSYVSARQPRALVTGGEKPLSLPVTFTPWLVGPDSVVAPSMLVGSLSGNLGPITVSIRGPEGPPGTGIRAVMSSQARPPNPLKAGGN
jgi:hypothetical protein